MKLKKTFYPVCAATTVLSVFACPCQAEVTADAFKAQNQGKEDSALFEPVLRFDVSPNPVGVQVADFDDDGVLDLVTTDGGTDQVTLLLGDGDGSFEVEKRFDVGDSPKARVVGDVDNNGAADVVVGNWSSEDISVLLGNGDGTFQEERRFEAGVTPAVWSLGDFNNDGNLDILLTNRDNDQVSVLLGNGTGAFRQKLEFDAGDTPISAAVGDVNGDGNLDAIVANRRSHDVSVFLGKGGATFQTASNFDVGRGPRSVTVGDFDGDEDLDIATANAVSDDVSVLLGNGDGTFSSDHHFDVGRDTKSIAAGDLNGDGVLDLVTANKSDDISVLLGWGDGTFRKQERYPIAGRPGSVTVADLNDDGHLDVVTANPEREDVAALLNTGNPKKAREPDITSHPVDQSVQIGGSVTLEVSASGTEPLTYQWRFEGARIIGATSPELSLDTITKEDFGSYSITVSNRKGSVTSQAATLRELVDSDGDGLSDDYEEGVGRYEIVEGSFTWQEAKQDAAQNGGHLATITTAKEWEAIERVLDLPVEDDTDPLLWIGASDQEQEERWVWVTDEVTRFHPNPGTAKGNFVPGSAKPNNNRNFLALHIGSSDQHYSKWNVFTKEGPDNLIGYLFEKGSYTDPTNPDTDSDGLPDGKEVNEFGTDPQLKDSDNDTFSDSREVEADSDPLDRSSYPNTDSDDDGLSDAYERGVERYNLVLEKVTWQDASTKADENGLHLVTITSEAEWQSVTRLFRGEIRGRRIWLGANEVEQEGQWEWVTGEQWSFEVWGQNEPNDFGPYDEDFVEVQGGRGFITPGPLGFWWNDQHKNAFYITEKGYYTDPTNADTDGDGATDGEEVRARTSPVDPDSFPLKLSIEATRDKAPLLEIEGQASGIWIIERSTDLQSWKSWKAIDPEDDSKLILDTEVSPKSRVYYRAVKQE